MRRENPCRTRFVLFSSLAFLVCLFGLDLSGTVSQFGSSHTSGVNT